MGAAIIPALQWIFTSQLVSAVLIRTILVNVVLGSLEIIDDNGEVLHAIDAD